MRAKAASISSPILKFLARLHPNAYIVQDAKLSILLASYTILILRLSPDSFLFIY